METIGAFNKTEDSFVGTIRTMTINVMAKSVTNRDKTNDKASDYCVYAGGVELGAGRWEKSKDESRNFLSQKLYDPSFAGPIRAAFFENVDEGAGAIFWNRWDA